MLFFVGLFVGFVIGSFGGVISMGLISASKGEDDETIN